MLEENECIICLMDTSYNDYLKLDCCRKTVHKDCLNTWIKTNIRNTEQVSKCFHCKGNNNYINTIIYYTRLEEGDNNNYDSDTYSSINFRVINRRTEIRRQKYYIVLCNLLCFVTIPIFCLSILFSEYYENNTHKNKTLL